jgi:hypothetical protein
MEFRKGQAAMEYLMTYGWAILVIVIVLAALLYLGVFNVQPPETCMFSPGLSCKTFYLPSGTDHLALTVVNGLQKPITVTDVSCSQQTTPSYTTFVAAKTANVGGEFTVVEADAVSCLSSAVASTPIAFAAGDTYSGKVYLKYYFTSEGSTSPRVIQGTIYVKAA